MLQDPEVNLTEPGKRTRWKLSVVYLIFFLSGAAGLIYEISWSRQIGLFFGHTVHAAAIVLASYFAGMSFGYWIGGRMAERVFPLLGYGLAEFVAAAWAAMLPAVLALVESTTLAGWLSSSSFAWQTTVRGAFCFLLMLPATTALGATLPLMAEFFSQQPENAARRISLAYALNTLGAFAGVLVATLFLLVTVGVCTSSYWAAGISLVCGIAACGLCCLQTGKGSGFFFSVGRVVVEGGQVVSADRKKGSQPRLATDLWIWFVAVTGFATLALEVLYTRMFSLVFHNSTYTFGMVIAVFLAGLALGAVAVSMLQRWIAVERLVLFASVTSCVAVPISIVLFVSFTNFEYFECGDTFVSYMGGAFALVALIVLPPITLLGIVLPAAWKAAETYVVGGQVVGRLTAANTIAATAGSLSASFLLTSWLGLWGAFGFVALMVGSVGGVLWIRDGRKIRAIGFVLAMIALVLAVTWKAHRKRWQQDRRAITVVHRWEGAYGWIELIRAKNGEMKIQQNIHYRLGSTGASTAREYRQGHLPLLLHENPRDVMFMGLGTGLTAASALQHDEVESVVVVELIPEVVEAARMLAEFNEDVVDHPKVEVRIDDARHYMLGRDRRFDVIVSDLFVPWESQTGYLYTVEHYELARSRLKKRGLFCQWLALYQVGAPEFEMIADSFASVFPETTLWWGRIDSNTPMVALIGSEKAVETDVPNLESRLERLGRVLQAHDKHLRSVKRFVDLAIGQWPHRSERRLNTDEHPRVEFLTPISHRDGRMIKRDVLQSYFDDVLDRLPSPNVRLSRVDRSLDLDLEHRRARQRLVLFGSD